MGRNASGLWTTQTVVAAVLELVTDMSERLRGTSAHRQVRVYDEARSHGASEREALVAVVDWLVRETASGLAEAGT